MTTPGSGSTPDHLAFDDLHAEIGDHPAGREALDELRRSIGSGTADRRDVERHVGVLQSIPVVGAKIANWFESPTTQGWLAGLSEIGL